MQTVEDPPIETIHLYVVREEEKRPFTALPLFGAFLCLVGIVVLTIYSAYHPYYEHERLTIPAHFLPITSFTATVPIIPTGIKTYPATFAQGTLTLTNGSVLSEVLPKGIIFTGKNGVEIVTESSVFIPAGSALGYGVVTVQAKAVVAGNAGNIEALAVNAVYGTSLYIRNLQPFTGGKDSYSVTVETAQDRQTALDAARAILTTQEAERNGFLAYPCHESSQEKHGRLGLSWACQFVTYTVPSYVHVTAVRLVGKNLFVDVVFVPRPRIIVFK